DGIRDRNVTGVQTCALPISIKIVIPVNTVTNCAETRVLTRDRAHRLKRSVEHELDKRLDKPPRSKTKTRIGTFHSTSDITYQIVRNISTKLFVIEKWLIISAPINIPINIDK